MKKKQFFILGVSVFTALLVTVGALLAIFWDNDHSGKSTDSPEEIPSGKILVDDIYEGKRLAPKFDLPKNEYDLSLFQKKDGKIIYDHPDAVWGVDVSEHQGDIDWVQAKESGVEFAFLRLGYRGYTQGILYEDETFETNFNNARAAGISVGVYFFSQAVTTEEAREEAEFVLDVLDGRELEYPVVFDWETPLPSEELPAETLRAYSCTGREITDMAEAFCRRVRKEGLTPCVYFNKTMAYDVMDLGRLGEYDFWYAEYQDKPSLYYDFRIWQYTDSGTVPGIGTVDVNIAFRKYS